MQKGKIKLSNKEKKKMLRGIDALKGISKHKTSDEDLHKAREIIFDKIEKEKKRDIWKGILSHKSTLTKKEADEMLKEITKIRKEKGFRI